jgi:hypothetical protein
MKKSKKLIVILCSVLILAAFGVGIFVMTKKDDVDLTGNICYADRYVYFGSNGNFAVSVYAGRGEKNFLTDGKAVGVEDFCKVILNVLNNAYSKITSFECEIAFEGGGRIAGKIEKNPLTLEHSAEITAPNPEKIKSVYVKYTASKGDSIEVKNVLEGRLSAEQAFDAAEKIFAKEIKESVKKGAFDREIYIKFVAGYRGEEPYYWYVAFIASDSDYWAVLLDSKTGKADIKRGVS